MIVDLIEVIGRREWLWQRLPTSQPTRIPDKRFAWVRGPRQGSIGVRY